MRYPLLALVALFCLPFFQSKGDDPSQLPKAVLLDNFYRHQTQTSKGHHYTWTEKAESGFSQLGAMFVAHGASIDSLETAPTKEILDHCSVYIIVDPNTVANADNHAPNFMDTKSADVIADWVRAGGNLVLMNNDKNNAEFDHFNILANRFGISFNQDVRNGAPHHEPDQMQLKTAAFSAHPILHDVALVSMRLICTLSVQPPAQAILTAPKESGTGTDVIMATSSLGKGRVFAVGDPWLYNEYLHTVDNGKAAENLVSWLLGDIKPTSTSETLPTDEFISDSQIRDVLHRVANKQIHPLKDGLYPPVTGTTVPTGGTAPTGIIWLYPWGVAMSGLLSATDVLNPADKTQIEGFVKEHDRICASDYKWVSQFEDSNGQFTHQDPELSKFTKPIDGLCRLDTLDECGAIGTSFVDLVTRYPDQATPDIKAVIDRIGTKVASNQARFPDGTLWRPATKKGTVWPDDLYMGAVFLERYASYTGDTKYLTDAAQQIINQAALQEDNDGLWFHGYLVPSKKHGPCKWGRGGGWAYMAMVEVLTQMKENDPLRPQVLALYLKFTEGLKKVQAPSGMWRQVLDDPDSWEETSSTAMFAYGIARGVHRGWLNSSNLSLARKAFSAIAATHIAPDGSISDVCMGTGIGDDVKYYLNRPHPVNDGHGPGPVLLAGAELLRASDTSAKIP